MCGIARVTRSRRFDYARSRTVESAAAGRTRAWPGPTDDPARHPDACGGNYFYRRLAYADDATNVAATSFFAIAIAQPISRATFDVASVKMSDPNGRGQFQILPGGTVVVHSAPLKLLMQQAYDVREFQVSGGPAWVATQRYDVIGKAGDSSSARPDADLRYDLMRQRLQSLLEDRFQLKVHRETKGMIAYALVLAKNGPKLKETADGTPSRMQEAPGV